MAVHLPAADAVFHPHIVLKRLHLQPKRQLPVRDLQRPRALGLQRGQLPGRPFVRLLRQSRKNLLDARLAECPLHRVEMLLERRRFIPVHRLEQPQLPLAHRSLHRLDHIRLAEIGCDPGRADIATLQPLPRQRQPHPQRRPEPRQKPSPTDIREQSDPRLRHRKQRPLRRHPVRSMNADAHATAHRHAIHEGDIGLGIVLDPRVQPVLRPEKRLRRRPVCRTAFRQHPNIAAGAESARVPGMVDDHQPDLRVTRPRLQGRIHREAHLLVQRM